MRPRSFGFWLALTVAAGVASCEINPQPGLPGSGDHSPGSPSIGKGGNTMSGEGPQSGTTSTGTGGSGVVLNPSAGTSSGGSGPVIGTGGANDNAGGEAAASEGGAGGAGPGDAGGVASDIPK